MKGPSGWSMTLDVCRQLNDYLARQDSGTSIVNANQLHSISRTYDSVPVELWIFDRPCDQASKTQVELVTQASL